MSFLFDMSDYPPALDITKAVSLDEVEAVCGEVGPVFDQAMVARMTGKTRQRIGQLITTEQMRVVRLAGRVMVPLVEVQKYMQKIDKRKGDKEEKICQGA